MRILQIHTRYRNFGGEDMVFDQEAILLRKNHNTVTSLVFYNSELEKKNYLHQAILTIWNSKAYQKVKEHIKTHRPEIVHIHNTFPFASFSIIYAAKSENIPIVMTLHNYRLICLNATLFRQGNICEKCLGKSLLNGILQKCYHDNYAASLVVATMQILHRAIGTWKLINRYIVLTSFAKKKFIEAGFPQEKLSLKPNFTENQLYQQLDKEKYALFVGRLSVEKGIKTLITAWQELDKNIPLKIAGDGPIKKDFQDNSHDNLQIEWLGHCSPDKIKELMERACFLIFPSEWYEGFPMVIVEAFSFGLPIITSNIGSQATIIKDQINGLHFENGNPKDLAIKVQWLINNPDKLKNMSDAAFREYQEHFSPEKNYSYLEGIYQQVINERNKNYD